MNKRLHILEVRPTVLFAASEPLKQLAYLELRNSGECDLIVQIRVDMDGTRQNTVSEETVRPGDNKIDIWIPDTEIPVNINIQVADKSNSFPAANWQGVWKPQRKWKIYIIKSSHYDLGYDGRVDHMQAEAADYLDLAKRLCADRAQAHEWHYYLENMGFIRAYERERKEKELRNLIDGYLKTGLMTLLGNPSGPHWHWLDYEQIARSSYPARREMKDRFGLDVQSVAIVDNTNGSWAAYQALAKSGFKYVFRMSNPFRSPGSIRELGIPKIFWIVGPNGRDKILCCLMDLYGEGFWIGQAGGYAGDYIGLAARELSEYLQKIECGALYGEYPYDALVVSNYVDWEIPHEDERILAKWRKVWSYPEIHLDNAGKAMSHINEKYHDIIPVLKGDTNNCCSDYTSIDPLSQGIKRCTARMLPFLEGLYTIAAKLDSGIQYPGKIFNDLYINLVEYDEHCWPTMLPVNDMNIFNTNIVKTHQIKRINSKVMELMKKPMSVILDKCSVSSEVLDEVSGRVSDECSNSSEFSPNGTALTVWNSLVHPRSDLVRFSADGSLSELIKTCRCPVISIIDGHTTDSYSAQLLETGEIVFAAMNIPAFGYKNFSVIVGDLYEDLHEDLHEPKSKSHMGYNCNGPNEPGDNSLLKKKNVDSLELSAIEKDDEIIMQNKYYKLVINKASGKVTVLDDRRLGRSLIDLNAPYGFNQWLHVTTGEKYNINIKELKVEAIGSSTARLGQVGPVMAQVIVETEDTDLGAEIITTYTLYRELDRLDISNKALHMDFLHTPAKDRYKENIFVAFPFNIDKPEFRVEHSTGTINPETDLLPSIRDFMTLNRWVDVSNGEIGVTMVSHEAATVHLGKIMYNQFNADYKPDKSHIYSYVWSNRMAGLTALEPEDYHAILSYSIRSHPGGWIEGNAAAFGWSQASPPFAEITLSGEYNINGGKKSYKNYQSFVNVDSENIQMTVLKRAEKPGNGYILRLVETEGKDCVSVKIRVAFTSVKKAWLCDVVENDIEELPVGGEVIELPICQYDMVTIRFTSAGGSAISDVDENYIEGADRCSIADVNNYFRDIRQADARVFGDSKTILDWDYKDNSSNESLNSRQGNSSGNTAGVNIYRSEDAGFIPTMHSLLAYTEGKQFIDTGLKPGTMYYYYIAPANRDNIQGNLYGPISVRTTLENLTPPSQVEELGVIPMDIDRLAVYWRRNQEPDIALYRVHRGDTNEFVASGENLIAEISPDKYWYQVYMDTGLSGGMAKYYKVLPVDYAGNVQQLSPCAFGRTPLRRRFSESRY
jgi:alpha-mannosidase